MKCPDHVRFCLSRSSTSAVLVKCPWIVWWQWHKIEGKIKRPCLRSGTSSSHVRLTAAWRDERASCPDPFDRSSNAVLHTCETWSNFVTFSIVMAHLPAFNLQPLYCSELLGRTTSSSIKKMSREHSISPFHLRCRI